MHDIWYVFWFANQSLTVIAGLLALVGIRGRWNIHKRQPDDVNTPTHQVEDLQKVAEAERDGAQAGSTEMSQLEAK